MSNLPPAEVLAARLAHELTTARIYAKKGKAEEANFFIGRAQKILAQLREAMK